MDKETLSNYGWIVICVLVLAVMIALATPFGNFVANAVKSTTQGLFNSSQKALNSTGLITISDQDFDENISIDGYILFYYGEENDEIRLSWQDLQKKENGEKYGYDHTKITNTSIGNSGLRNLKLVEIKMPDTIIEIGDFAFCPPEEPDWYLSVTLSNSLEKIGKYAFYGCYLNEINFGNCTELTTIEEGAFSGTSIHIEVFDFRNCKNLTYIGHNCFDDTSEIRDIYFSGTIEDWEYAMRDYDVNPNNDWCATVYCKDGNTKLYTFVM